MREGKRTSGMSVRDPPRMSRGEVSWICEVKRGEQGGTGSTRNEWWGSQEGEWLESFWNVSPVRNKVEW